jgi:hypothetical protein
MNNVEEAALRSLPGDSDFKNGISRLIAQIKEQPFSLAIASGTGDFPTNSNFTQGNFQIEVKSGGRELKWKGILSANEEAQLRNLSGDTAFTNGVEQLINQIKSHLFAETISFAWPRVDKLKLQAQIKHELAGLELPPPNDNGSIQWKGVTNLGLSSGYLIARVKASLRNGDPFIQAFANLLQQIAAQEFSVAFTLPRLLRCKEPLTEVEKAALKTLFSSQSEQLNRLFDDLDDKQTLEGLYQDWFSQEPTSKTIASLPSELKDLVDFPEPPECTLVWKGEMSPEAKAALLTLSGDDGFKQALTRLTSIRPQASELPDSIRNQLQIGINQLTWNGVATDEQRQVLSRLNGDESFLSAVRNLVKAVEKATNNSVTTVFLGDVIKVTAPLGLDQIPGSLANKIQFPEQSSGNYTKLRWTGALFDEDVITLKRWAQIPQFLEAVNSLLQTFDKREIPISLPEEVPSAIANKLQITPNSLAWLGTVPNAEQRTALQSLSNDTRRQAELRDAVGRLLQAIDTDAGNTPVVTVTASGIKLRPQQDDLPAILKPQLTLTPTQVTWTGRLHSNEQLKVLQDLMGDAPLKEAIASIITTLTAATEINFTLPVRPQPQDLPERLRDKLLIGRTLIRYHGLMTVAEAHQLQAQFTTQTDKDAIARLYEASSNKGLRGRELKIRARRGSAAPSEMNAFTPKQL